MLRSSREFQRAMVIAMAIVDMVQPALDQIIGMVSVRHCRMTAVGSMPVFCVMSLCSVRAFVGVGIAYLNDVLIHMVAMDVVKMAIVQIIGVAGVLHCGVPAIGSVLVVVILVFLTFAHKCNSLFTWLTEDDFSARNLHPRSDGTSGFRESVECHALRQDNQTGFGPAKLSLALVEASWSIANALQEARTRIQALLGPGVRWTTAAAMIFMVLFCGLMSSSPALHRIIHPDANQEHHECAITIFAHGHVGLTDGSTILIAPPVREAEAPLLFQNTLLGLTDYLLLPSRAPPGHAA